MHLNQHVCLKTISRLKSSGNFTYQLL